MRLNPLKYVGKSIPCQGSALLGDTESAWDAAAAGAAVVRSNMTARRLAEPALDLAAIEREARAAQTAWIAHGLRTFFAALARKILGREQAQTGAQPDTAQRTDGSAHRAPADAASLPRSVARTY